MEDIEFCAYKKQWGYAPLLISLANTQQPLVIVNRPGNATSSKDAAGYLDVAASSMLNVFERVVLRGDTDFSQTKHLDRWHNSGRIDFVFGFDACPNLVERANELGPRAWHQFKRPAPYEIKTQPRTKPRRIKDQLIRDKGWKNLKTLREDIAEFKYQPGACKRAYRMIVLRKQIEVTQGQLELEPVTRYFFYITNLTSVPAREIVIQANKRCNQENLIAQLKGHVSALKTTGGTLESNWAWMVIASLAWTLKSWFALLAKGPAERNRLLGMEFRTFQSCFIEIPVQVVRTARRSVMRIIGGYLAGLQTFLDIWTDIRTLCRIRV